jgi:hypothetical protein
MPFDIADDCCLHSNIQREILPIRAAFYQDNRFFASLRLLKVTILPFMLIIPQEIPVCQ